MLRTSYLRFASATGLAWLVAAGVLLAAAASHAVEFQLHGRTWTEAGRIMNSTDTLQTNFSGNWQQSMGMQIQSSVGISERLSGSLGLGLSQVYHSLGNPNQEKFVLSKFVNYVTEARLTYALDKTENPFFRADFGSFAFNYAPYVKNLGLYLFRGPVYPGFLVSGFKEYRTDTTRAGFLGLRLHNGLGNFQQDFLVNSERDLPPSFDWSLGYVARYKAFGALEIGAGVNFYHLIAENPDITDPKRSSVDGIFNHDDQLVASGVAYHPQELHYYEVMGPGDTVTYTHRGVKVGGFFSFDLKKALGVDGALGEKDLLLYGETALIGVRNHGSIYAKRGERMPFMFGFNLPTFGVLDFLSVEVERYTARYRADYSKLGFDRSLYFNNIAAPPMPTIKNPSAIPISAKDLAGERYKVIECPAGSDPSCFAHEGDFRVIATGDTIDVKGGPLDPENLTADDWKWSVNAEKTFAGHVQFAAQVANDHLVARPTRAGLLNEAGGISEVLSSMKDWYFMLRIGYFF
ncbi:MAG: hypothetical protein ABIW76_03930 [Fibrobacteria bacterium]